MSAMWKKDSCRSPTAGRTVKLTGFVVNAASERNEVVSDNRLVLSVCRPQCSEFLPEWDIRPSGGVAMKAVDDPTTCVGSHSPGGQWMCQSMSLSAWMLQFFWAGGTRYPKQPTPESAFRPPCAVPTVYPKVSLGMVAGSRPSLKSTFPFP